MIEQQKKEQNGFGQNLLLFFWRILMIFFLNIENETNENVWI